MQPKSKNAIEGAILSIRSAVVLLELAAQNEREFYSRLSPHFQGSSLGAAALDNLAFFVQAQEELEAVIDTTLEPFNDD